MQPYFFPYIGYFSLIKNTDFFVFFDTPQYIRKGWINRNRILCDKGVEYITIPVEKVKRETPINQIKINYREPWKEKILGRLKYYKNKAPYFNDVYDMVEQIITRQYENISQLAIDSIKETCNYIGLDIKSDIFSSMSIPQMTINGPDEWALNIAKYLGYDTYINPEGGKSFFDAKKYEENKIDLLFLTQNVKPYNQKRICFEPRLSILDVMMFCDKKTIIQMMNDITIEKGEYL